MLCINGCTNVEYMIFKQKVNKRKMYLLQFIFHQRKTFSFQIDSPFPTHLVTSSLLVTQKYLNWFPAKLYKTFSKISLFRMNFSKIIRENISSRFLAIPRGGICETLSAIHRCQLYAEAESGSPVYSTWMKSVNADYFNSFDVG